MHLSASSVAVHKGLVIATDFSSHLHCLDENTGKQLWSHDPKGQVLGHPLIVDGNIYLGNDNGDVLVLALQKSKKLVAKNEMDNIIRAPQVFANGVLYVLTEKALFAISQRP